MRAWTYTSRGNAQEVLKLRSDVPRPTPSKLGPTEAIVKVAYASPFIMSPKLIALLPHFTANPWIPELSFSGKIENVGAQVTKFKPGDLVFGGQNLPSFLFKHGGAMAEYVVIREEMLARKPEHMSLQSCAGISANASTAVQIADAAKLKRGNKVLITAASGSLGTVTVQIIKAIVGESGSVVAVCSGPNADMVRKMGADEVIDYTQHPNLDKVLARDHAAQPFDLVIDIAGTDDALYQQSPLYLTAKGLFVFAGKVELGHGPERSVASTLSGLLYFMLQCSIKAWRPTLLGGVPRRCVLISAQVDAPSMEQIQKYVDDGSLQGHVDSEWAMEDLLKVRLPTVFLSAMRPYTDFSFLAGLRKDGTWAFERVFGRAYPGCMSSLLHVLNRR